MLSLSRERWPKRVTPTDGTAAEEVSGGLRRIRRNTQTEIWDLSGSAKEKGICLSSWILEDE